MRKGAADASTMPIVFPPAQKIDASTGEYQTIDSGDDDTSGGDIGAQVPINPTVWVSSAERIGARPQMDGPFLWRFIFALRR